MPKARSNTLFVLIKSLSKSEKRYFKLSQTSDEDQKYLRLFELLDLQADFNDEEILLSEPSFNASQYSNLKAHLYGKILRSLRDFSMPSIAGIQIRELIDEAQILFNKSLYQQCSQRIKKAAKLATKTDNLELQLEILQWKKRLMTQTVDWENQFYVDEVVAEVQTVNERINNINTFSNLQAQLQSHYRKSGYLREENELLKISQITAKLSEIDDTNFSISEKLSLYHVYIGYYVFVQDFKNAYVFAKKWVDIFRSNHALIQPKLDYYIQGLNYLLIAQNKLLLLGEFQETKKELRSLNKLPRSYYNENIRVKLLKYTFVHEFNSLFLSGEFDKGVALLEHLSSGVDGFINQLDAHSKVILFYKAACLYFGNGNFKQTIFWINKILVFKEVDLREDIHGFARILNLISHYELGNIELIEYYVRSTYRFLMKKEDLHQYQKSILRFLKSLHPQLSSAEVTNRFKSLRDKMLELRKNPFEMRIFVYFDIVSWLDSKIDNRPLIDILKEKALERERTPDP
ncbi:MAG: hypothetical protein GY816_01155 [Cytophagales bacterium]|nr:hypothetical protein [Cytophagales bacterium]